MIKGFLSTAHMKLIKTSNCIEESVSRPKGAVVVEQEKHSAFIFFSYFAFSSCDWLFATDVTPKHLNRIKARVDGES